MCSSDCGLDSYLWASLEKKKKEPECFCSDFHQPASWLSLSSIFTKHKLTIVLDMKQGKRFLQLLCGFLFHAARWRKSLQRRWWTPNWTVKREIFCVTKHSSLNRCTQVLFLPADVSWFWCFVWICRCLGPVYTGRGSSFARKSFHYLCSLVARCSASCVNGPLELS